ncbi:hypothetical protein ACFZA1_20510 [Streptomyces filipinensis]|uniref:hypothetical protein n=1 Tax=Streptomyces filipinensis TaxID=66887 RepID=UPI0036E43AE8
MTASPRRPGPRVRIAPVAYGFGPVGKALHIARAIRAAAPGGLHLELTAPAHFAATAEPGLFDAVHDSAPKDRADLVVCVMNRAAAATAAARGERVVFVDSLAWLWDEPLPVGDFCDCYLYQDLPVLPVPERNIAPMREAIPVGAIADAPAAPARSARPPAGPAPDTTVVSIAGVENFEVSVEAGNAWYARLVIDALRDFARRRPGQARQVEVFGNTEAIAWAGGLPAPLRIGSGAQRDFLAATAASGRTLASPGLTTIIELLSTGVPLAFLPPQNYSQVRIARAFAETGIPGLNWDSEALDWLAGHDVPERVGSQIVRNTVAESYASGRTPDPDAFDALLLERTEPLPQDRVRRLLGALDGAADVAKAVLARL